MAGLILLSQRGAAYFLLFIGALITTGCGVFYYRRAQLAQAKRPMWIALLGAISWILAVVAQVTILDHYWKPHWFGALLHWCGDFGFFLLLYLESTILLGAIALVLLRPAKPHLPLGPGTTRNQEK